MTTRILPAVGDTDTARSVFTLLSQLPDADPAQPVATSTVLLDTLAQLAGQSVTELPEVVLVHEGVGPVPALELIREVALRFPAVAVVLLTSDGGPGLYSAAMDSGARGVVPLPLSYEELAARVASAASWAVGVRRHLSSDVEAFAGPGGTVVSVSGAKGGTGATTLAVQLALAAQASGRSTALVDFDLQSGDVASYLDVQFRRSVADLGAIGDISPRVLADVTFSHESGLSLLLAPGEGERAEEVEERAARQIVGALRSRYDVVVVDTGAQLTAANAVAIEMADTSLVLVTPDVVAVRAAKRMVRMWGRLQIRKPDQSVVAVNRHTRGTEIQPPLVERIVGARVAQSTVPAGFKELQPVMDAGRMQDLDPKSSVKQAMWALAGELGLVAEKDESQAGQGRRGRLRSDRGAVSVRRRGGRGADSVPEGE